MGAGVIQLRGVRRFVRRRTVKLSVVEKARFLQASFGGCGENVEAVFPAIYVADLIAIERGNRQFLDLQPRDHQLHDDFCVEMEVVGVSFEGDRGQGADRVETVAGMEFAHPRAEQAVLKPGERLVSEELVERHATLEGSVRSHHARAEDSRGLARLQGFQQFRQALRRVLAVSVNERYKIVAVLQRVPITDLLIAAVPLIHRVIEGRDGEGNRFVQTDRMAFLEGRVFGRIVDDQNVGVEVVQQAGRNPVDYLLNRLFGVVGDDEDQ